jgi:TPP-dependent pyruvate/acetoin dehydrogenase alpha subunit
MNLQLSELDFLSVYEKMQVIRQTEEGIASRYQQGEMRCPTHLSIGQEGVPSVLSILLQKQDQVVSTHRAHAHYLGKGGCLKKMLAEIYGKQSGCSHGRGGSMHLIDQSVGFMGSTAIVGNTIPIGVGLALAKKIKGQAGIAVIYLGDGAVEEGVFYESANFAATRNLPVLFVCENNLYSVYSSLEVRQPKGRAIHQLASSIGLNSCEADGNDILSAHHALSKSIQSIKQGAGPAFVELATYRWLEHCGANYDNDIGYRSEQEFLEWKKRDPIAALTKAILSQELASRDDLEAIEQKVRLYVETCFEFAQGSAFPISDLNEEQVYAKGEED